MPCRKYKGKQRRACYATGGWKRKPKRVRKARKRK